MGFGQLSPAMAPEVERGAKAIRYMRERDCDFLTVENVQDYGGVSEAAARAALILEMGAHWYGRQCAHELERRGWDVIPEQRLAAMDDGRLFAVVRGRRWTRIHEYLTNGQLTARFFVDESTGEAREAAGARAPKRWPMHAAGQELARAIIAAGDRFEAGEDVTHAGYPGTVTGEYLPGMYEVRLAAGAVVVSGQDLKVRP